MKWRHKSDKHKLIEPNTLNISTSSYPYGMLMDGRHGSDGDRYRYSFQGQEHDDEVKGEGNSVNYKYRMHNVRLGRFFARDPIAHKYPHNSPYAFSENRVTNSVELEGLEAKDNVPSMAKGANLNFKWTFGKENESFFNLGLVLSWEVSPPTITRHELGASLKADITFNLYNGGTGSPGGAEKVLGRKKLYWDHSAIISTTLGGGTLYGIPQYSLNPNTQSGISNYKKHSITYGQGYSFMSTIGKINTQATFGFRLGALSISSANDGFDKPYLAFGGHEGHTDYGMTGFVMASARLREDDVLIEAFYWGVTGLNKGGVVDIRNGEKIRTQTSYQRSLNKASFGLRIGTGANSFLGTIQLEWFNNGILQRKIHDKKSKEYFDYTDLNKVHVSYLNNVNFPLTSD